jgi:hypothetical protein
MTQLAVAVHHHVVGNFSGASQVRLAERHSIAFDNPMDPRLPGIDGTLALSLEREGKRYSALDFVRSACFTEAPADENPAAAAIRNAERPSTHLNVGTVLLREAARRRRRGSDLAEPAQNLASALLHSAWAGIGEQEAALKAEGRTKPHQHRVNAIGRLAMLDAVEGRYLASFGKSFRAISLARRSESPELVEGATENLTIAAETAAKLKAMARGFGSLAIAALSLVGARDLRDRVLLSRFGA